MTCLVCRRPIEVERLKIGLDLCRYCGDAMAARDLRVKRSHVGPAFNKGGPMYLGGGRQAALDAGRKASAVVVDQITPAAPRQAVKPKRRKRIGAWYDKTGEGHVWFAGDDPDKMGATRKILFGDK